MFALKIEKGSHSATYCTCPHNDHLQISTRITTQGEGAEDGGHERLFDDNGHFLGDGLKVGGKGSRKLMGRPPGANGRSRGPVGSSAVGSMGDGDGSESSSDSSLGTVKNLLPCAQRNDILGPA